MAPGGAGLECRPGSLTMRRKLIWLLLILSIGTAAACAWAARELVVVEWSILQLKTGGPQVRETAARRLGRRKAARAVPALFDAFRSTYPRLAKGDRRGIPPSDKNLAKCVLDALLEVGDPALIVLIRTVNDRDPLRACVVIKALRIHLWRYASRSDPSPKDSFLRAEPWAFLPEDAGNYSGIVDVLATLIQIEAGEVYEEANRGIAIAARRLEAGEITR